MGPGGEKGSPGTTGAAVSKIVTSARFSLDCCKTVEVNLNKLYLSPVLGSRFQITSDRDASVLFARFSITLGKDACVQNAENCDFLRFMCDFFRSWCRFICLLQAFIISLR